MTTNTFIELIETCPDILFLSAAYNEKHNVHARKYQGKYGNLVIIDTTEEDLDENQCKEHCHQLGLVAYINIWFPSVISN